LTDPTKATIRVSRRYSQSAERVFDAWLDPAMAAKFLFVTPTGQMVRAETDPRIGGAFCFVDRRDGNDIAHYGKYLEIDRPRRLVFDITVSPMPDLTTLVIIEIIPDGTGCELTLTHEGLVPAYAPRVQHGWVTILDGLASALQAA
jgi:uncharacterized protein YndB with AHSA1/START domain